MQTGDGHGTGRARHLRRGLRQRAGEAFGGPSEGPARCAAAVAHALALGLYGVTPEALPAPLKVAGVLNVEYTNWRKRGGIGPVELPLTEAVVAAVEHFEAACGVTPT